jgi:hypothetical protein
MTDRELLELAAKAAGLTIVGSIPSFLNDDDWLETTDNGPDMFWNPLQNDGDALRLAVKLNMGISIPVMAATHAMVATITFRNSGVMESCNNDPYAATRRSIVRAAAEIGRNMK